MELKTFDEIYLLEAFSDYKESLIEHCFIYIQRLDQYALVTHSGILFDDYKFVEDIKITNTPVEDLGEFIKFIEENLGPIIKITKSQSLSEAQDTVKKHSSKEEIIASIEIFKKYKRTHTELFWSEKLEKYYLVSEKGIMFEDEVFYTSKECLELQRNLPTINTLKAIHAAKHELGWDQVKFLD
jgi:hypothetical protein